MLVLLLRLVIPIHKHKLKYHGLIKQLSEILTFYKLFYQFLARTSRGKSVIGCNFLSKQGEVAAPPPPRPPPSKKKKTSLGGRERQDLALDGEKI